MFPYVTRSAVGNEKLAPEGEQNQHSGAAGRILVRRKENIDLRAVERRAFQNRLHAVLEVPSAGRIVDLRPKVIEVR